MASHIGSNVGIIPSLLAYAAFGFLSAFISNWPFTPKTIDSGEPWVVISDSPFIQNTLLFLLFPLQHSGQAFDPVRTFIKSSTPEGTFDRIYAASSSLVLITICGCWTPIPIIVWSTENIPALFYTIRVLNFLVWSALLITVIMLGPVDNRISEILRQLISQRQSGVPRQGTLITTGPYALCRHPIYTFFILATLVHPVMTVGHLIFCSMIIIYAVLAVVFLEEPRLIREFGTQYKQYMARVARFVPGVL